MRATASASTTRCKCNNPGDYFCLDHMIYICEKELPRHKCNYKKTKDVETDLKKSIKKLEKEFPIWKTNLLNQMQEHLDSNKNVLKEARNEITKCLDRIIEGYDRQFKMLIDHKVIHERKEHLEKITQLGKGYNIAELLSITSVESNSLEKSSIDAKFYFERDEMFKLAQSFLSFLSKQISPVASLFETKVIIDKYENFESEIKNYISNAMLTDNRFFTMKADNIVTTHLIGNNRAEGMQYADTIINTFVPRTMNKTRGMGKTSTKFTNRHQAVEPITESFVESQRSFGNFDDYQSNNQMERVDSVVSRENLDFDLDDEDFDFGDDEILEHDHRTEDIKTTFENSQQKLLRVLDRVLYDMNCPGFYDKSYREAANSYMDRFKETLESVLKEVKNNFNRL